MFTNDRRQHGPRTFALFFTDVVLQALAILIDFNYIELLELTGLEIVGNVSQSGDGSPPILRR